MNKAIKISSLVILVVYLISCTKVPITGRKQTNLLPESELIGMSTAQYGEVLSQSNVVSTSNQDAQMIQRVGDRISEAVEKYLADHNLEKRYAGFDWEFKLIDEDIVNAWCMPGGKVAFYTGILPVCQDEAGVAVVMGHEIAHAIARHGNERMSQGLVLNLGLSALSVAMNENPTLTKQIFLQSVGIGSQLGMLSFSRKHESEADHMGLVFMAMAGYDPREAPDFWERMSAAGGAAPPEFLSTHPSHDTRVNDLNALMDEALKYYVPRNSR
jgi:predicted Zn-dependent protease